MKKQAEMDRENRNAVERIMRLVRYQIARRDPSAREIFARVKAEIADAHHRGYLDGDAAQMDMRVRDEKQLRNEKERHRCIA